MTKRRRHGSDSRYYYDWMEMSYIDLQAANLLKNNEDLFEPAAFHCQQSAEKALKAYIIYKKNKLVDGHNLTWLCKQAVSIDKRFTEWLDESAALNRYYIETRYPSDIPRTIKKDTIERNYKMAYDMFYFIAKEIEMGFPQEF